VSALCLLDLTAAFDTFHHSLLLTRLQKYFGVEGSCLEWFLARSCSLFAVACLSVCLSATLVRPTQAVQIFGNICAALGTLAIR